jgi:hypothetical protein
VRAADKEVRPARGSDPVDDVRAAEHEQQRPGEENPTTAPIVLAEAP